MGQIIPSLELSTKKGLSIEGIKIDENSRQNFKENPPLFSFVLNEKLYYSFDAKVRKKDEPWLLQFPGFEVRVGALEHPQAGEKFEIKFINQSRDTLVLENFVPLGEDKNQVHITGLGDHRLSRTHLFIPGKSPVNIIVPDNAWELGYGSINIKNKFSLAGLSRRISWNEKTQRRRFETLLFPGGSVKYSLWLDIYEGRWQEGLKMFFQERYLYDLPIPFEDSLYQRKDLKWIRHAYAMHLIMAWDHQFYDHSKGGYQMDAFLDRAQKLYGGDDIIGLWPNWPMLGLDQRNQWDLYRDMPGGTQKLQELAQRFRSKGTRFFISYNPWDESTRWEDHHSGMSDMIKAVSADGVVLDTEGKSTPERQLAADKVRDGVVMYSEGMAVPKDMPGILAGRVHNALYYPPLLNLNKLIRPDFAIFRVAELNKERIRREYALSLFNGYGTELNIFRPGRPYWADEDYRFWGKTLRILRENTSNFNSQDYRPLYPSGVDKIYINYWPLPEKEIFTIFSLLPEGFSGPLFQLSPKKGYHLVDLWHHEEILADTIANRLEVAVKIEGFSNYFLGTNNEGAVGGIAYLPEVISASRLGDQLSFSAKEGDYIKIWPGNPTYEKEEKAKRFGIHKQSIRLMDHFGRYEGKFVIQVFKNEELLDEKILFLPHGTARLVSKVQPTQGVGKTPEGMVKIPGGPFQMKVTFGDNFIPNPVDYPKGEINFPSFYMDKHPVTNLDFKAFLDHSHYRPLDTTNFLKHWKDNQIPSGQENFPVIYISYEDAKAYAKWAGKRLPSEMEWQYAAQTPDLREWPWSKKNNVQREQKVITNTLTVSKLQVDSELCNTGTGSLYPVGSYPKGANPFGLEDLVGCVWQICNDVYDNGTNYFCILKGGSYFLPASSWWYVEGGPRELTYSQKLLRVSPGFERNAATGFRCVVDSNE